MFKAVSKVIIVALIFVAFIGQTLALSIATPCDTSVDAQHSSVSERIEHKDPASIDTELSAQCCDVDCCDLDCICIANTCSSIVYVPAFLGLTSAFVLTTVIFRHPSEQPNSFASLLYRPPIFA
ncbi:hypothetical protein [Paraglaciecola arctica]|uniref:Uncharacterized protein n=1 Tax=Paraglaciecola arctica BSs20135 TaxID=493475 RepID=K6ZED9_9ALTE|nr:hypothetical protein [Paraglaciecola arctica]GAC21775.1 hypothetical protein GARC_4838 [Paraglaciecola arctica BSs20135]|tara:strand:- start:1486 stop:1857 length:372 start_codon:yes stop_codon:yes gene_type:complete